MTSIELAWPGAFGARDLGGIAVPGGVLRRRVLFRSGRTQGFETAGWLAARRDGVRTVVDLRPEAERTRRGDDPDVESSATDGIRLLGAPVEDPSSPGFRERFDPYLRHPADYADYTARFAPQLADALSVIAHAADEGGVLVHCSAGRDRTGLVLGLVLVAAGVDDRAILAEDELATRAVNAHHGRRVIPHPFERHLGEPELAAVVASRAAGLRDWLGELRAGGPAWSVLVEAGAMPPLARIRALLGA